MCFDIECAQHCSRHMGNMFSSAACTAMLDAFLKVLYSILTICALCRTVPAQIPGIVFLSGGQTEEEATVNLNAINQYAQQQNHTTWSLTFSYGRGLQVYSRPFWCMYTHMTLHINNKYQPIVMCSHVAAHAEINSTGIDHALVIPSCQHCVALNPHKQMQYDCIWYTVQASVMSIWSKDQSKKAEAKAMAAALAAVNASACQGKYHGPHPSILKGSLHESFRGWNANVKSS